MSAGDIVGRFFLKSTAKQIQQLLGLLEKNTKGKSFASHAVITPDMANLPGDVLSAIPVENIQNSKTGTAPTDSWGDILGAIKVTGVSVVGFLANEVVAVANLLVHAPEIIQHYALALWNTAVNAVQTAVAVVKKVVSEAVEWIKSEIEKAYKEFLDANREMLNGIVVPMMEAWDSYRKSGEIDGEKIKEFWESMLKVIVVSMVIWGTITALMYVVMGMTVGAGDFVFAAIGLAIQGALNMNLERGNKPSWLTGSMDKNELINDIASNIGEKYTDSGVSEKETVSFFLSLFSMGLSFIGWAMSAADDDASGTSAGMVAAAIATGGMILAGLVNTLKGDAREHMRWICYGFSVVGIFVGLLGMAKALAVGNGVASVISLVGVMVSTGIFLYSLFGE